MGRSDYCEAGCMDHWDLIRWRGAVAQAIRGKRGQQLLRELLAALDTMPEKRLISHELEKDGQVCALGCVGRARCITMNDLDPESYHNIAERFGISQALVREIEWINDEQAIGDEERYRVVRAWVERQLT